jgi:hypothetical protein
MLKLPISLVLEFAGDLTSSFGLLQPNVGLAEQVACVRKECTAIANRHVRRSSVALIAYSRGLERSRSVQEEGLISHRDTLHSSVMICSALSDNK